MIKSYFSWDIKRSGRHMIISTGREKALKIQHLFIVLNKVNQNRVELTI